ncbi:hypothetical protein [Ochrobactrum sp. Marseille-Q0166]|uniref:hypothetical protein n=1 Tax=Ochrobactrum sp. Marseille-Q0166 TaxID=2761105 RepID=UPI001655DC72|nr:hypothetical protein [Ochrobactrum sp. Marseille-Q0166]MBC8719593.1 hypothetical protein [Ochrobactrum sp. Marseille-Q0166]
MQQIRGLPTLQRGQIIDCCTIHKLLSAENIIETAHRTANEIIEQAEKDANDLRRHAQQQGLLEGRAVFDDVSRYFNGMRDSLKSQVLGLLQQCLGRLLSEIPRQVILELTLETAMRTVRAINPRLTLHVAPENFEPARRAICSWREKSNASTKIDVEIGTDLQPSECRLYAGDEVIESSLDIIADGLICAFYDDSTSRFSND